MLKTLRTAPVTAELRYLGNIVVISLGLCAVAACLVSIAVAAHLGFVGFLLLLQAAGACTAIGGAWWLLRRTAAGRVVPAGQTRPARCLPLVLDIGFFGWAAAVLAGHVEAQLRGAPVDANRWAFDGIMIVFWGLSLVRDVRTGFLKAEQPAFDTGRLQQMQAACALPTRDERRRAMAPLRNRGFGRLAIIAAMLVAMAVLVPHVGAWVAFLIAFGGAAAVFLVLHRLVDL